MELHSTEMPRQNTPSSGEQKNSRKSSSYRSSLEKNPSNQSKTSSSCRSAASVASEKSGKTTAGKQKSHSLASEKPSVAKTTSGKSVARTTSGKSVASAASGKSVASAASGRSDKDTKTTLEGESAKTQSEPLAAAPSSDKSVSKETTATSNGSKRNSGEASEKSRNSAHSEKSRNSTHSENPRNSTHSENPRNSTHSENPRNSTHSENPRNSTHSENPRNTTHSENPRNSTHSENPRNSTHSENPRNFTHSENSRPETIVTPPEESPPISLESQSEDEAPSNHNNEDKTASPEIVELNIDDPDATDSRAEVSISFEVEGTDVIVDVNYEEVVTPVFANAEDCKQTADDQPCEVQSPQEVDDNCEQHEACELEDNQDAQDPPADQSCTYIRKYENICPRFNSYPCGVVSSSKNSPTSPLKANLSSCPTHRRSDTCLAASTTSISAMSQQQRPLSFIGCASPPLPPNWRPRCSYHSSCSSPKRAQLLCNRKARIFVDASPDFRCKNTSANSCGNSCQSLPCRYVTSSSPCCFPKSTCQSKRSCSSGCFGSTTRSCNSCSSAPKPIRMVNSASKSSIAIEGMTQCSSCRKPTNQCSFLPPCGSLCVKPPCCPVKNAIPCTTKCTTCCNRCISCPCTPRSASLKPFQSYIFTKWKCELNHWN